MYEQYPAHCPFATRCKCGFKIAAIVNKKKSWEELSAIEGSGFDAIMDKDNQSKENPAESWYRWIFSKVIRLEEPMSLNHLMPQTSMPLVHLTSSSLLKSCPTLCFKTCA